MNRQRLRGVALDPALCRERTKAPRKADRWLGSSLGRTGFDLFDPQFRTRGRTAGSGGASTNSCPTPLTETLKERCAIQVESNAENFT